MRLRYIGILMILSMFFLAAAGTAQDDETWYLRQDTGDNNLVMFTLSGEEQIIGQSQPGGIQGLYRVADDTFIGTLDASSEDETDADLYRFTPDGATPFNILNLIEDRDAVPSELSTGLIPIAFSYPYVVLTEPQLSTERLFVVVNAETAAASLLDYQPGYLFERLCCRFASNDAGDVLLRYAAEESLQDEDRNSLYRLVEQNLTTGTTTVFHERTARQGNPVAPDSTGERWIFRSTQPLEEGGRASVVDMVTRSSDITTLVDNIPVRDAFVYQFSGDLLLKYLPLCDLLCTLEVISPDEERTTYRGAGDDGVFVPNRVWQLDDETQLLVQQGNLVYLLDADSAPQLLIEINLSQVIQDAVAIDGQMLTMPLPENRYGIYDVSEDMIVGSIPADMIVLARDFEHGYMLSDARAMAIVYHPATATLTELTTFAVTDILSDGRIFYNVFDREQDVQSIHLHNAITGEDSVLYRDATMLNAIDLRYLLSQP